MMNLAKLTSHAVRAIFVSSLIMVITASLIAQQPKYQINPGKLIELNKPGTIDVTIDIGLDDGIRPGVKLSVVHDKKVCGTIQITSSKPDRSIAKIIDVLPGKVLSQGDEIQLP